MTKTVLTVHDGENHLPVSIDDAGQFTIERKMPDGSTDVVARETFAALKTYAENVAKRAEAKARKQGKGTGIRVTHVTGYHGTRPTVTVGTIYGMADGQNRVLQSGFAKDKMLSSYDTVYKPFTDEDTAEYLRLWEVEDKASRARQKFLEDRHLGIAKQVARDL